MEIDAHTLELNTNIRYTIGQMERLNHGRVKLPPKLEQKIREYTMPPCCIENPYNNPLNTPFRNALQSTDKKSRQPLLKKTESIYSDEHILKNLRHAFSAISKGTGRTILAITDINQIMIPKTMVEKVAKLFFDVIAQCPLQMNEYLAVLFGISYVDHLETKIHFHFVKFAMSAFATPYVVSDSLLESGESLTKKHRTATCQLIARLFMFPFSSERKHEKARDFFGNSENLHTKFLQPVFHKIQAGDADEVSNLVKIWDIIGKQPKFKSALTTYIPQMKVLLENKDKKFKMSTVLLLRGFI